MAVKQLDCSFPAASGNTDEWAQAGHMTAWYSSFVLSKNYHLNSVCFAVAVKHSVLFKTQAANT